MAGIAVFSNTSIKMGCHSRVFALGSAAKVLGFSANVRSTIAEST
jgi:hypothetical protein